MTHRRGFTLVEALVALLVAALTASALAVSIVATLRARHLATRTDDASRAAERALEEFLLGAPENLRELAEERELASEGLRIERRIRPGPRPDLWEIEVEASPLDGRRGIRLWTLARGAWRPES
jgi:prepilin-type N-terminal cleavage/methylation domain-containing protein